MAGTFEAGAAFGKYRIIRVLGRGGMGVVYLAEDETLGREVALKALDRSVTSDDHFEARFRQEARTIAQIKHPGIVGIHSLERIEDDLVIDMEYVAGGSLAELLGAAHLSPDEAVHCVADVLNALASCHESGVIHRDVKPSNILLSSGGQTMLSDFGLAKLAAEHFESSIQSTVSSGFFVGTPRYAPPESWDGQEPAPAWDVYSCGAVLYEALSRRPPYEESTPFALIRTMIERPPVPLLEAADGVSEELAELVDGMLSRDAAARPQTAGDALERLLATPEAEGARSNATRIPVAVARQSRALPSSGRSAARRWGMLGITALVFLLSTGLLASRLFKPDPGMAVAPAPGGAARPSTTDTAGGPWFFDAIDQASQEIHTQNGLILHGGEEGPAAFLAVRPAGLWFGEATRGEEGRWTFSGHWAEYATEAALAFRMGAFSGEGTWLYPGECLSASFEFEETPTGAWWDRQFILRRTKEATTERAFVQTIELGDCVQALLYNELMPRNLAWTEALEEQFLAKHAGRTTVPLLGEGRSEIDIDGSLTELAWRPLHSSDGAQLGVLAPRATTGDAALLVRHTAEGLYLGVRIQDPPEHPRLSLALITSFAIPVRHSPRWSAQIEGGAVRNAWHERQEQRAPWECRWLVAEARESSTWTAEIFVPFSNLGEAHHVRPGSRWRLNCVVADADAAEGVPMVQWGAEGDVARIEHGCILVFGG